MTFYALISKEIKGTAGKFFLPCFLNILDLDCPQVLLLFEVIQYKNYALIFVQEQLQK